MNKSYYNLEIEIILFAQEDVIRTSLNRFDDVMDDIFDPKDDSIVFG